MDTPKTDAAPRRLSQEVKKIDRARAAERERAAVASADASAVRAATAPIVARRYWVWGLLGVMGLGILNDLLHPGWMLLFDTILAAAAWSLYRAMNRLGLAAESGRTSDLSDGLVEMERYVRINAIAGWVLLVIGVLVMIAGLFLLRIWASNWIP